MTKTIKKSVVVMMVVAVLATLMVAPTVVSAATPNPYVDVTDKTVGKETKEAIAFVKKHGGYKGIVAGTHYEKQKNGLYKKVSGKFYPNKMVTRKEFIKILGNLYGPKNVPVTYNDMVSAGTIVTDKYAKAKLVAVGKKLGLKIKWDEGTKTRLSRASVANYIDVFAHFNKAFMPKK